MGIFRIFFRAFESAYRSVSAVRWKSAISILTILIGSLAITTTFTISQNVDGYVQYLIDQSGGPKVTAYNLSTQNKFTDSDLEKFRKVSVVKSIYGSDEFQVKIRHQEKDLMIKLAPVTAENVKFLPYKLTSGHFISADTLNRSPNTIVLSEEAVRRLGVLPIVGKYINVKLKGAEEIRLKVIGIAKSKEMLDLGSAWINFKLYQEITGKKSMSLLHIVSRDSSWMNWVESFGNSSFAEKFGSGIWLYNPLQEFVERKNQLGSFIQMGYILGFLALIAGSIGSTSVMILNVNLRKREIGLYKSMGFSPFIILLQFTCETLILSLFGGLVGALMGSFIGLFISQDIFPVASMSLIGFSLGLSSALVTGLVFGLIPAVLAARMDPVQALQG